MTIYQLPFPIIRVVYGYSPNLLAIKGFRPFTFCWLLYKDFVVFLEKDERNRFGYYLQTEDCGMGKKWLLYKLTC